MAAASDYLENQLAAHLLRTASLPKPPGIFVALYTTLPDDADAGGTEVSGGSYARVEHGPADSEWDAPSSGDGKAANATTISFPAPTADWGTVVGWALRDAPYTSETVAAVDTANDTFTIPDSADITPYLQDGNALTVSGSTGNDGTYTVASASHDSGAGETTITVNESVGDSTADGTLTHEGNQLVRAALTTDKTVNNGDPGPEFNPGALTVTFK